MAADLATLRRPRALRALAVLTHYTRLVLRLCAYRSPSLKAGPCAGAGESAMEESANDCVREERSVLTNRSSVSCPLRCSGCALRRHRLWLSMRRTSLTRQWCPNRRGRCNHPDLTPQFGETCRVPHYPRECSLFEHRPWLRRALLLRQSQLQPSRREAMSSSRPSRARYVPPTAPIQQQTLISAMTLEVVLGRVAQPLSAPILPTPKSSVSRHSSERSRDDLPSVSRHRRVRSALASFGNGHAGSLYSPCRLHGSVCAWTVANDWRGAIRHRFSRTHDASAFAIRLSRLVVSSSNPHIVESHEYCLQTSALR